MTRRHMGPELGPYAPLFHSPEHGEPAGNGSETTDSPVTSGTPNSTATPLSHFPCQWILSAEIGDSRVRIWDVLVLVPSAIFLLFLLVQLRTAVAKLKRTSSPIFSAFYVLVFSVASISVLRCVVSMTVNAAAPVGGYTDKVLWLVLRFMLLATELSVVCFGLAFGHLDSRTSIQRVIVVTCTVALIYTAVEGVLEFKYPEIRFHVKNGDREYDLFAHGGMIFWCASSVFFFVVYTVILILPWTSLRNRFAMPSKKSFYVYCTLLSLLNLTQAVGTILLYYDIEAGLCICDGTALIYFTMYTPLVYFTFLRDFFKTSQPTSILFSYKAQLDDDEDTVSLPHQTYVSNKRERDSDSGESLVNSTLFDQRSPNPLYNADIPPLVVNAELSINTDYFDEGRHYQPRPMIT